MCTCMHDRNECSQSAWDKILDCSCENVLHYSTVELGYNVMKGTEYLDKRVLLWPRSITLLLTVRNSLVPQDIWRYRRGVTLTDIVITGFDCRLNYKWLFIISPCGVLVVYIDGLWLSGSSCKCVWLTIYGFTLCCLISGQYCP